MGRRPDPADRRAVLVEATAASCALLGKVERACADLEEQTLAGLDTAERRLLPALLARVESNLCTESADRRQRHGEAAGE